LRSDMNHIASSYLLMPGKRAIYIWEADKAETLENMFKAFPAVTKVTPIVLEISFNLPFLCPLEMDRVSLIERAFSLLGVTVKVIFLFTEYFSMVFTSYGGIMAPIALLND